ncbi:hypothetical protein FD723_41035 (plasmid) [Nostoc sp. C052]|uniref:hypothetical protein n=1 Tax=Nostoc sp. C052 TaxID=2576902 RepID=UPI0015C30115|nr:hypothetical protein [Nostoc sp. C052]QLE46595.1 hypothetical protein FD723_41035 [Nostoc sp. C052]
MKNFVVKVSRKEYFEIEVTAENKDEAAQSALSGELPDWKVESVEEVVDEDEEVKKNELI